MIDQRSPVSFDEAMRRATISTAEMVREAGLKIYVLVQVHCSEPNRDICAPQTCDLEAALRMRRRLLDARDQGAEALMAAHKALHTQAREAKAESCRLRDEAEALAAQQRQEARQRA